MFGGFFPVQKRVNSRPETVSLEGPAGQTDRWLASGNPDLGTVPAIPSVMRVTLGLSC